MRLWCISVAERKTPRGGGWADRIGAFGDGLGEWGIGNIKINISGVGERTSIHSSVC